MLYSKLTGGFYDTVIHGSSIPNDAVEIADDEYVALMVAQGAGKRIQSDQNGKAIAVDMPIPSANDLIFSEIAHLEVSVSQRRIREATLGIDNGWLKNLDDQIANLRKQLI